MNTIKGHVLCFSLRPLRLWTPGQTTTSIWNPKKNHTVCVCVCMYVEHLNRCKTSIHGATFGFVYTSGFQIHLVRIIFVPVFTFHLFSRGTRHPWPMCATKLRSWMGYLAWSARRTCDFILFLFRIGRGSTQEPPRRIYRTLYFNTTWGTSCTVPAICTIVRTGLSICSISPSLQFFFVLL